MREMQTKDGTILTKDLCFPTVHKAWHHDIRVSSTWKSTHYISAQRCGNPSLLSVPTTPLGVNMTIWK